MLTADEFAQWCQRLGLTRPAQTLLTTIRTSPPSRHVRGMAGNVTVRYPSRKMGVTIQAESHRNELAGIYEMEHDPAVLEYYDQPPPIKLCYQAKSGKPIAVLHTPDFFVLRAASAGWEEWKPAAELERLAEAMPHRYRQDAHGQWRCPPGEAYATALGCDYRVRSAAQINWIFQRNLLFLEDYLRAEDPLARVAPAAQAEVLRQVAAAPGLTVQDLLPRLTQATSDDLYGLLATEHLYVDLSRVPLAEPERVPLFIDRLTAQAYALMQESGAEPSELPAPGVALAANVPILWDGRPWTIANTGATEVTLLASEGTLLVVPQAPFSELVAQGKVRGVPTAHPLGLSPEARTRLAQAGPADLQEANRRYALIQSLLHHAAPPKTVISARTLRRWVAHYRRAAQEWGCGYLGLLPRLWQSGNRQPRLPPATCALLDEFITTEYETPKQKRKVEVYGALVLACAAQGLAPPSYKTFAAAVNQRPQHEQLTKRMGPRGAYPQEPCYWELSLTTPRHGDRPFEIAHLDHTELDLELRDGRTGHLLGRPWASFLVDAYTRRLLAVYVAFEGPSYRACMMVLRECVRQHQRLPQTLVVDGGAEFASTYFETLLARYEVTKKTRPGAKPRFGAVLERLFGTLNTSFIDNLAGNTQLTRHLRQVSPSVDPKQFATWTLDRLYRRLREWAYEVYDTQEHPALGQSPREAFAAGLFTSGQRPQRLLAYDTDFVLATLPTTRQGWARVQPNRGVKIHYLYYWAEAFRNPAVENTRVPVRYDPYDAGTAYAFVAGQWVRGISEHYARFQGRSEREIQLASVELRQRQTRHGRQLSISAAQLAAFLTSAEAEEVLHQQRARDAATAEVRAHLAPAGGVAVVPPVVGVAPAPAGHRTRRPGQPPPPPPAAAPRGDNSLYEDY